MLARVFTRLFYAAVFFALGVWAAPSMGGLSGLIDDGVAVGRSGFETLWSWAESTISSTPAAKSSGVALPTPAPKPVATVPAPAPVAVPAATPAPVEPAKPVAAAAATVDPLVAARSAHARGDVAGAVRAYDDLIARRPDDAAVRGELGNVFWNAGRMQEAAKAYHGAALVLIAARRLDDAARLEAAVRQGDPALADDLARRLAAGRTN